MATDDDSKAPIPSESPLIGRVFGGSYRIVRSLAEGGMASVFEAEHVRLKRPVAVKVIAKHLANDPEAQARFEREAETISQLHHPNIVQVTDFNTTPEGEPYLVMELLRGESLATLLERESILPLERIVLIIWQVASALSDAHGKGIVHRDLTPANVFLTSVPGQPLFVKLLDFGISKAVVGARNITRQFEIVGTVQYMAPEQAIAGTVDTPVDQFSVACIVYRALSGQLPFTGKSPIEVLQAVAFKPHAPIRTLAPELPVAVEAALDRAMAKDPAARFPQISDFAVALAKAADSSVSVSFSTAPPPLLSRGSPLPPPIEAAQDLLARVTVPAKPFDATIQSIAAARQLPSAREQIALAEGALSNGDDAAAWAHCAAAEEALPASEQSTPEEVEVWQRVEKVYETMLGGTGRRVRAETAASADGLTPGQAFLLSRVGSGSTVEELLDLSHLSRRATLRHLVTLSRSGHLLLD